jgi:type III secretion protein I
MIEIVSLAARAATEVANRGSPAVADPAASQRFAALMAAAPESPTALPPADPAPLSAAIGRAYPVADGTLGERILQGLNGVQSNFKDTMAAVSKSLDTAGAPPSVSDLLRLQLSMAQLSLQAELVGKVIGRSTQNIDQLVRMQ